MLITKKKTRKENHPYGFRKVARKEEATNKNEAHATIKKVIHPASGEISLELKPEQPHVRYLKLQPLYRQLQYGETVVPELRLNGRWLERAGFDFKKYVSVTIMDGLLIIKPVIDLGNG
ncbi:MAG: type I toxin-antitoxin system SymE family toxin [Prevotella sp.]|jgi:cell division inhibitor SulA|nr:type I toxin-antitoxin system SymE family toxin [Prevotella sp.]